MDRTNDIAAMMEGFPVVITMPVQWGDQDAFAHVNNVVYFRWFESSRIAYFERIGLLRGPGGTAEVGPILASSTCHYRRPIVFPDTVHIGIRATKLGRTSLGMEHRIVSEAQRAIAADGHSTGVFYDYNAGRPHPIPVDIRKAVEALEGRTL